MSEKMHPDTDQLPFRQDQLQRETKLGQQVDAIIAMASITAPSVAPWAVEPTALEPVFSAPFGS